MNSNEALLYFTKLRIKNLFLRTIKKPFKLIGLALVIAYFVLIPFTFVPMIEDLGFNTPQGFVILVTVGNIWITLPSLLTYLKRKGIAFDKSDVNLMFATPIKSKNILIYSIYKQAYISIVFTIMMSVAGVFIFHVNPLNMMLFFVVDLFIYNTLLNMCGVVMYGSYKITDKVKKIIRYTTYSIMLIVLIVLGITMYNQGSFDLIGASKILAHPLLFLLPVIGQGIAAANLIVLGPNLYNVIGSIALVVETLLVIKAVQRIPNDGEYYEDALSFADEMSRKIEQAGKGGNVLFLKKRHKKASEEGSKDFKSSGASVIFERQVLELKRSSRLLLGFRDIATIIISITAAVIIIYNDIAIAPAEYFMSGLGFIVYISVFFSRKPLWFEEFNNLFYYSIPDKAHKKLFFANLLDYIMAFARNTLIIIPISIGARQSFVDIIAMIIAVSLVEIMVSTGKMIFDKYLTLKVNQIFASFASLIFNGLSLLPIVGIIMFMAVTNLIILGTVLVMLFCFIMTFVYLFIASKLFSTAESFKN